ncbi:MAG: hypothetical protein J5486_08850 [Bacteroidaceae bacterium]|nr:hypothetical protein [Bacteroidaceae bacterium]
MNRTKQIVAIVVAVVVVIGVATYFLVIHPLQEKAEQNEQLLELAEMDKAEMRNEYESFARQYSEMRTQISNDSLIAQLSQREQEVQNLLQELEQTKASDAAEISRLRKELATMRQVLKSFVAEIDSLNRLNTQLTAENEDLRQQRAVQQQRISDLNNQNETLTDQVAIAAQLNATGVVVTAKNKKGKPARKIGDVKKFQISFSIARNVTTQTGMKTIYVRILKPTGEALNGGGTFTYANRQLEYSIRKDVEYNGEETAVTVYWDVNEMLLAGTYRVQIFADGNEIGGGSVNFDK